MNELTKSARKYAKARKIPVREYTTWVKKPNRQTVNADLAPIAGDGRRGFHGRKPVLEENKIVVGLCGQFKPNRKSAARPRKHISRLTVSRLLKPKSFAEIEQEAVKNKQKRKETRNRRAKRGTTISSVVTGWLKTGEI